MRLQYVLSVCILLMMPTNGQTQELLRYKSQPDQQVYKHKSSTLIDNSSINYWDRAAWTSTERFADSADGVIEVSVVYTKVDQTLTLKHHMTAHTASGLAMGDATSGPLDQDVRGLLKDRTFSHRMTDRGELTSLRPRTRKACSTETERPLILSWRCWVWSAPPVFRSCRWMPSAWATPGPLTAPAASPYPRWRTATAYRSRRHSG